MSQRRRTWKAIQGATLRRLRNTPSYFFLIWRWSMWLYALGVITLHDQSLYTHPALHNTAIVLLVVTFVQTAIVTLYAPVLQVLLPRLPRIEYFTRRRIPWQEKLDPPSEDTEVDITIPLGGTRNFRWDIAIYSLDVLICGLVLYYSGPLGAPPFGDGSPFYRYGMSTVFAAALAYRNLGGLLAAIGYDLFSLFGMIIPAPHAPAYPLNFIDIIGSLIDTPLIALLTAYVAVTLKNYTQSIRQEQHNVRTQRALVRVGETLMRDASNREQLLQDSVTQIRQGGHFQRLIIALTEMPACEDDQGKTASDRLSRVSSDIAGESIPDTSQLLIKRVMESGKKLLTFEPLNNASGHCVARLYLPLFKDGRIQLVLGAESIRQTPFAPKKEEFLTIAGTQLLVALDNIRLTEQAIELTTTAERNRIAREIHDGIAQLVYMLSLNIETCSTQAHRMAEASEEDAELFMPLANRLDTLVTISKQALWETRNYMFNLKPLLSGTTNLTQMLTNQLREFQTISGLPTHLEVEGDEVSPDGNQRRARRYAQVGAAIFRIVQEALTNAYKHADATQLWVCLHYLPQGVEVEICDDGHGMQSAYYSYELSSETGERQRIYSGHGMRGMRERAEELGGLFEVDANPDEGVRVRVQIPID